MRSCARTGGFRLRLARRFGKDTWFLLASCSRGAFGGCRGEASGRAWRRLHGQATKATHSKSQNPSVYVCVCMCVCVYVCVWVCCCFCLWFFLLFEGRILLACSCCHGLRHLLGILPRPHKPSCTKSYFLNHITENPELLDSLLSEA